MYLFDALESTGGLTLTVHDLPPAAEALAVESGEVWARLDWQRRAEYERQARAVLESLGITVGLPFAELPIRAAA